MTLRAIAGFFVALVIALVARRTRSLATSGAVAATLVGTVAVAAGWNWGALLILYFATSTALSHFGKREKERRTASVVEKSGERDGAQVLANGLPFAVAALGAIVAPLTGWPSDHWLAFGAGSLAASAADTWATEIGTLYGEHPRSILTRRPVEPGTSGGVSIAGQLASVAGAAFVALVVVVTGTPRLFVALLLGGVFGSLTDSLLGATLQARRWCEQCRLETERTIHDCGMPTTHLRGLRALDNDLVNFVSAIAGGLLAASLAR